MISREVILESNVEAPADVAHIEDAEELEGKIGSDPDEQRLAHSVLENDTGAVDDGKLLAQAYDYSVGSFTPDLFYEQLVERYRTAQRLYGPTIIRQLTGYDGSYIEKNAKISEFRDELRKNIHNAIGDLKKKGLVDKEGEITELGVTLASLVMYTQELDHLRAHGLGTKKMHERAHDGDADAHTPWKKQRYRDIDIRESVRLAVRRGHRKIGRADLRAVERSQHGKVSIIYAIDASGSMRGEKMHVCKRAGIALAYRAIEDGNDVGLIVFTSSVQRSIAPTQEFPRLLRELVTVRAGEETDLSCAIAHAMDLFAPRAKTKHLVLLTDALPTRGEAPGVATMEAVSIARDAGITISIVGMQLEREGEQLAKQMVELGGGTLYRVKNLDELDLVVLEEYERVGQSI